MDHFIIESRESGHVFGVYSAPTGDEAIRVMLRDSGDDQNATDGLKATPIGDVSGRKAIRYAKAIRSVDDGVTLVRAADPTEGERVGLSYSEAEDICAEDPSLVRLAVTS